jgi:hypothetical protein
MDLTMNNACYGVMMHDRAHPQTAALLQQLGFEILKHSLYCHGLASLDFYLPGSLKDALRGE